MRKCCPILIAWLLPPRSIWRQPYMGSWTEKTFSFFGAMAIFGSKMERNFLSGHPLSPLVSRKKRKATRLLDRTFYFLITQSIKMRLQSQLLPKSRVLCMDHCRFHNAFTGNMEAKQLQEPNMRMPEGESPCRATTFLVRGKPNRHSIRRCARGRGLCGTRSPFRLTLETEHVVMVAARTD